MVNIDELLAALAADGITLAHDGDGLVVHTPRLVSATEGWVIGSYVGPLLDAPASDHASTKEGTCAERLLTVVATCRQQGRRLLDFLVAGSEAALRGNSAPSLLPVAQGR